MLERFTIDIVAEQVASLLLEGEPTPKLAHRFFRKGRRDGRRDFAHASLSQLLQEAVSLAGSSLSEEFVSQRRQLRTRIAELEAATHLPAEHAKPEFPIGDDLEHRVPDESAVDSDELLRRALEARRRYQERRSRHDAMVASAERRDAARQALSEVAQLNARQEDLLAEYVQRFESIAYTGRLLWSRYCNGFVQGCTRRGSRGPGVKTPVDRCPSRCPVR